MPAVALLNLIFLTYWDVADGEEANPCVSVDCPLLRLAVGLTAVVHKAGVVAFGPGVDDAVLWASTFLSMIYLMSKHVYYKSNMIFNIIYIGVSPLNTPSTHLLLLQPHSSVMFYSHCGPISPKVVAPIVPH